MARKQYDWASKTKEIKDKEDALKGGKDDRFWNPPKDEKGEYNSATIVRMIPDANGEPFVKYYDHVFPYDENGTTKYYSKKCVSTFGYDRDCPICKKAGELYKSAFKEDKEMYDKIKRKVHFVTNMVIIKNAKAKEEEGKLVLFKFGNQLKQKLDSVMFPKKEDYEKAESLGEELVQFVPCDYDEGANLKLITKPKGEGKQKYPTYEDSCFAPQSKIWTDEQIEEYESKAYDLSEFVDESKYPTNEEVIKQLSKLLGVKSAPKEEVTPDGDAPDDMDTFFNDGAPEKSEDKPKETPKEEPPASDEDFFKGFEDGGDDDDIPF